MLRPVVFPLSVAESDLLGDELRDAQGRAVAGMVQGVAECEISRGGNDAF